MDTRETVVLVTYDDPSKAFKNFNSLKESNVYDDVRIHEMVVVENKNGKIKVPPSYESGSDEVEKTAIGGIAGAIVGMLAGPVGVIVGAGIGLGGGMAADDLDVDDEIKALKHMSENLPEGQAALALVVTEKAEGALDSLIIPDATITRWPAIEVNAEMERVRQLNLEQISYEAYHPTAE